MGAGAAGGCRRGGRWGEGTHDDASNLTSYADQNGPEVTSTFDAANQLTGRSIDPASGVCGHDTESYAYDALGRVTQAVTSATGEPTITVERAHDTLGRVLSETQKMTNWTDRTISYEYDGVGNVVQKTYPSGFELHVTSDALGREI